jgi:hypothetical protein
LFLSGFSDVTTSTVFSYQVVIETGKFLFRENSLQSLSSNFRVAFSQQTPKVSSSSSSSSLLFLVGADLKFSLEISRQKSFGLIGVVFCWALAGILFLARADDGIVVSGASVQVKPEAHKRGFPKATVKGFHTKGWTNFFSAQILYFLGQNNVFHYSVRPQTIFR